MPVLRGHDLVYAYTQVYFHKLVSSERDLLYINLLLSPLTWGRMCEVNGLWASGLAASTFTGGAISLAHIDFVFTCRASNARATDQEADLFPSVSPGGRAADAPPEETEMHGGRTGQALRGPDRHEEDAKVGKRIKSPR